MLSTVIDQARSGEPITVHGDGEQTRDFIQVGEAFNIATGEATSIRELAESIQELTGTDSDIAHIEGREDDIERSVADIETARDQLDYESEVTLKEGLKRTVDWFRENAD